MNSDFPERTVVSARSDAVVPVSPVPGTGGRDQFAGRGSGQVRGCGHHVAARTMGASMTVPFHLSPEQEQLKLGARQFAEEHLRPLAAEVRKEPDPLRRALLARPTFDKAVAEGFLKGLIPAPFGGAAAGGVEACILIEEWARPSPDFVISLAGPLIALAPVYEAGTPEQIQRFVAPFLADHRAPVAAMAVGEPEGNANFAPPPPP